MHGFKRDSPWNVRCRRFACPEDLDAVIKFAQIGTKHRKSRKAFAALEHLLVPQPFLAHTRRMTMLTKITLALAFAFAVIYAVPASANPRTCGSNTVQYDSSGTWTGPYCD